MEGFLAEKRPYGGRKLANHYALFLAPLFTIFSCLVRAIFGMRLHISYIFPTDSLHIAYIISREGVGKQWRRSGRPPNKGRGRYEGFMKKG